jgi:hypothetical protein
MRTRLAVVALTFLLFASTAAAQDCDEEVLVTPGPGSIGISHRQSLFNCCCTIEFEVVQDSYLILVREHEVLVAGGCDCHCCFDAEILIEGLAPGDYDLNLVKFTEHGGMEIVGYWLVTVTGESLPSLRTAYLPCAETGTGEDYTTWGVIKAMYR